MNIEYKQIDVNKTWISENISGVAWQRKIYPGRVNNFINHIKNGTFRKNSLITLWKKESSDKYQILDGQHKLEAIKITDISYLMDLRIIYNATEQEMMEEYLSLADVKHHRTIDIVKLYVKGHKNRWLLKFIDEEEFPINITLNGGVNSIRLDNLLIVLFSGLKNTLARSSLSKNKLGPFIESLSEKEYSLMSEFCEMYKICFGDPAKDNWMYKNAIMFNLLRIWIANKDSITKQEFIDKFKMIEQNAGIRQQSFVSFDKESFRIMTHKIYKILNYKRISNKFIQYWDEEILIPRY